MEVKSPATWPVHSGGSGITLRVLGEGMPVFVFPGMEGSGESCLHVVLPVLEQARRAGRNFQLLLVDYAAEQHPTLDELIGQIHEVVARAAAGRPCVFWAQSFGNLLATGVRAQGGINAERFLLVSAFTELPQPLARFTAAAMRVTPTFIYRMTIEPLGRLVFGPVGEESQHPFFASLKRADSPTVQRRTNWLCGHNFSRWFSDLTAPTKIWLGMDDRLVAIDKQRAFFERLAQTRDNFEFSMIPGSGHVILPHGPAEIARKEILDCLMAS